jgi:histidyl-tRNA synthetase
LPLIPPRTFRGTRDFLPAELLARRRIVDIIEEAYRRYGFQPLETPAIEYLEILTGKSEENDKLIYEIKRARGEQEETAESAIALRYDLTVPLARVVAQYAELPRPFKRYQIQPVWRADRPQPRQGRFREFVQCDADIVGTDSLLADAEIIALTYEVLRDLGFEKFKIRLSSRQLIFGVADTIPQAGIAGQDTPAVRESLFVVPFARALDKLDKIGWDGVAEELVSKGIYHQYALEVLKSLKAALTGADFETVGKVFAAGNCGERGRRGVREIRDVFLAAMNFGVPQEFIELDPFLARGLDYYTGPIFETVLPDYPHIGSLSGGGRYDGLVQTFSKERVPATGTTIGLDRIQTALTELGKFENLSSTTQVLVARFDAEGMSECSKIASELRRAGVRTELWYDDDKLKKQLAYANQQGIPLVVMAGPDERARGMMAMKNMRTGEQKETRREDLVETVKAMLPEL